MTFTPIKAEAEREFRRFMDSWREKHSPTAQQESEMVYRVLPMVAENLEQMTCRANESFGLGVDRVCEIVEKSTFTVSETYSRGPGQGEGKLSERVLSVGRDGTPFTRQAT